MKSPLSCEQQKAILALLETMGRLAPQLSVLRMDGALLQPIPPYHNALQEISILGLRALDLSQTFRALRHLTIDVWAHGNDLQMLQGLTSLEVLRVNATRPKFEPQCDLDLPFLTGLTQFHFSGVAPVGLRLPASCQCTLVSTGPWAVLAPLQALLPAITPWLVPLEVTLSESLDSVVNQDLFKLDVHLERLTIECGNFATQESSLVAGDSCLLLTQAKHVELLCSSAYLQIPADAQLAWSLIRELGRGQVWVSAEAPEVFLSRCSFARSASMSQICWQREFWHGAQQQRRLACRQLSHPALSQTEADRASISSPSADQVWYSPARKLPSAHARPARAPGHTAALCHSEARSNRGCDMACGWHTCALDLRTARWI